MTSKIIYSTKSIALKTFVFQRIKNQILHRMHFSFLCADVLSTIVYIRHQFLNCSQEPRVY